MEYCDNCQGLQNHMIQLRGITLSNKFLLITLQCSNCMRIKNTNIRNTLENRMKLRVAFI